MEQWRLEEQSLGARANEITAEEEEDDEMVIEVLPHAVQRWFLLDKCGLDPFKKSVIQGDLKGQFTLAGVENQR